MMALNLDAAWQLRALKRARGLLCVLLFIATSNAKAVSSATLPELVQQADVICIGTTEDIQLQERKEFETGGYIAEGKPLLQAADEAVATFAVENILKGEVKGEIIKVVFPKNLPATGANQINFTELQRAERVILFLKATPDKARLLLLAPGNYPATKIPMPMGNVALESKSFPVTPLRLVLLYLTAGLESSNKPLRLEYLQRIQSVGFLLNRSAELFSSSMVATKLRNALREPNSPSLEEFIKAQVLPGVVKLTNSPDADVRTSALLTAAKIQDVAVIPQLVELARSKNRNVSSPANNALRYFRVTDALRPLISLLQDDDSLIRQSATFALRGIADPLAVPALVERLDDPDGQVRQFAISGLYFITGKQGPSRHEDGSPPTEKEHLNFWKEWAAKHPDKLETLRQQLNELDAVPATPATPTAEVTTTP